MRFFRLVATALCSLATAIELEQVPLLRHADDGRNVSVALFSELEELARIVDISYCVGLTSFGIVRPFQCLSRCSDFPKFYLVTTWDTGPLLSDSCGYIALDHGKERIMVAFRGTYSIANTIVDLSTIPQDYVPFPGSDDPESGDASSENDSIGMESAQKCSNCTVHRGFHTSWLNTRARILPALQQQIFLYPRYKLSLVGHSLGGAVAALAGLDFQARGWDPVITTFGEPRVGNKGFVEYLDTAFSLSDDHGTSNDMKLKYRRVTHIDDPVPLLPLTEWGYAMHAGEIYISKPSLSPDIHDLELCEGDNDPDCIAKQDSTTSGPGVRTESRERDLLVSVQDEIQDVKTEPWGVPSRYKLWQLFFAHRDYFWRLGLCVPGGDPLGGGKKYGPRDEMQLMV